MSETYHKINAPFKRNERGVMLHGQWCRPEFEFLADNQWQFTEKVDGSNHRLIFNRVEDYVECELRGKTDNAQIPAPVMSLYNEMMGGEGTTVYDWDESYRIHSVGQLMIDREIDELTVYGEMYGPKINGGGKYGDSPKFVVFDVKVGPWMLQRENLEEFCESAHFDIVPVIGYGILSDAIKLVQEGLASTWGDFEAEGVIAEPAVPLSDRAGNRIITKIKAKDFRKV